MRRNQKQVRLSNMLIGRNWARQSTNVIKRQFSLWTQITPPHAVCQCHRRQTSGLFVIQIFRSDFLLEKDERAGLKDFTFKKKKNALLHHLDPTRSQKSGNGIFISNTATIKPRPHWTERLPSDPPSCPYLCCMCRLNLEHAKFSWAAANVVSLNQDRRWKKKTALCLEAPQWLSAAPRQ